jgi:hypothetical protein
MADAGDLTAASSGALAEKIKEWTPEMMMHSFKVGRSGTLVEPRSGARR